MERPAHILLVGNDGRLLNERAELLSHFWAVTAVSAFDRGMEQLRATDLMVLCHTVTEEQRTAWISSSRVDAPALPIVSLEFFSPTDTGRRAGVDATVGHNRGPAALVSAIYEMLTERGVGSKPWASGGQTLLAPDGLPALMER